MLKGEVLHLDEDMRLSQQCRGRSEHLRAGPPLHATVEGDDAVSSQRRPPSWPFGLVEREK
jgi:hypothetical protein